MHLLDLTLPTPAANLALDEVLLEAADGGQWPAGGVLRLWEAPQPMVVVGRGTRLAEEVQLGRCREEGIPVLRRISGGTTIVAGPGCLMYAVIDQHPLGQMPDVDQLHQRVLGRMVQALQQLGLPVQRQGTSDLAVPDGERGWLKFSGNSLRFNRRAFLYHGTLLYDFDLALIEQLQQAPPREPAYRAGRGHGAFVTNLGVAREELAQSVATAWQARENLADWPHDRGWLQGCTIEQRVQELCAQRYEQTAWNESR